MQRLIQHLIRDFRLAEPIAQELGKRKETLQRQILRGNPGYDERMRIVEAFKKHSRLNLDPVTLFSPVHKNRVHLFLNTNTHELS